MIKSSIYSCLKHLQIKALKYIHFFYHPFEGLLPADSFRYIVCGGANTAFEAVLYFIAYNFIFQRNFFNFLFFVISPHVAAFLLVFPIVFFSGFLLSRYLVFKKSLQKGKVQLMRFGLTILTSLVLQYVILKFFVEWLNFFPTPSKVLTSAVVALFTFLSHRYFSFSSKKFF